jgi:hypothetical protein
MKDIGDVLNVVTQIVIQKRNETIHQREMISLNNVQSIKIKQGIVTITYKDGIKFTTKDDIILELDYKNKNDYPLVDHCI